MRGFGNADPSGGRVTPQTPFYVGLVYKPFTAFAIMQLIEAGKLELDQPIQRYLPWFQIADTEASACITIRHLLTHTSGLQDKAAGPSNPDRSLEQMVLDLMEPGQNLTHPAYYEISVKGQLTELWSEWFDGLTVTTPVKDETVLTGWGRDQAALHRLLAKIRDLGLPLLMVIYFEREVGQR